MRFLPCPTFYRNSSVPALHCLQTGQTRFSLPEQSLSRLPELTQSPPLRGTLDGQRPDPSNGSNEHRSNSFRKNLLEAFVSSIIDHSPFRSIFSYASGYPQERGIAAYGEAARFQRKKAEMTSRFIDTYV